MEQPPFQNSGREASILDNALVMITVLDDRGKILSWNHAAEIITGYSQNEVIGSNSIWKKIYPDDAYRKTVTQKIAEILKTKNFFENLETAIRTRSGESRTIIWNTKMIHAGGLPQAVAVGMDVTAEREASAFRESIIDNAYVLIAVLDPQGTIRVWNKAAEMITGYSSHEVIGRRDIWKKIYPDADYRGKITRQIGKIISEKKYFENLETTIRTKTGGLRIISWNTRQIGSGGVYHEIAIGRDITEQRKAEEALVAYMTEMTMRLKHPIGIIGTTLQDSAQLVKEGLLTTDELITILQGQARNTTQITENLQEFQTAIVERNNTIPDAYRKFLEG